VAPIANAGADTTGLVNVAVAFDGSGSSDPDGTIEAYDWDWGDGTEHGTGATPSHTYTSRGLYEVTLKVTDNDGITATDVCVVNIYVPPVAVITTDNLKLFRWELGSFSAESSYDPDGTIVSYNWDWGDGTADNTTSTAMHSWTSKGTYTVTLTVTDNDGVSSTATVTVTILTPCIGLKELIDLLYSFNLKQGINNSLDVKLQHAQDALCNLERQDFNRAVNLLEAFMQEVEAQRDKYITSSQADQLLTLTERIIASIPVE